jgi:hypothetical protein
MHAWRACRFFCRVLRSQASCDTLSLLGSRSAHVDSATSLRFARNDRRLSPSGRRVPRAYALGYGNVAPSGLTDFQVGGRVPGLTPWVMGMSPLRGYADSRAGPSSQGLRPGLWECRPFGAYGFPGGRSRPRAYALGYGNVAPSGLTDFQVGGRVPGLTPWVMGMSPLRGLRISRWAVASQGLRPGLWECRPFGATRIPGPVRLRRAYAPGYRNVAPSGLRGFPGRSVFAGLTPRVIGMSPHRGYADSRAGPSSQGLRPGLWECRPFGATRIPGPVRLRRAYALGYGNVAPSGLTDFQVGGRVPGLRPGLWECRPFGALFMALHPWIPRLRFAPRGMTVKAFRSARNDREGASLRAE